METEEFLRTVVTSAEGWFNLSVRPPDGKWRDEFYRWPEDIEKIVQRAIEARDTANVYFTAHLFSERKPIKENVLPGRTIQADLDDAQVHNLRPNVLVETSPNRHQAYWLLPTETEPGELERLSHAMTYSIENADRSGWSLGHKMRLPGTLNHKYASGPKPVRVISANLALARLKIPDLALVPVEQQEVIDREWIPEQLSVAVGELWHEYAPKLPSDVVAAYKRQQQDRSVALGRLIFALFRAGLSRDEVFWIARESANNKWAENKFHSDYDLAKDVARIERKVQTDGTGLDERETLARIRSMKMPADERKQKVAEAVRDFMQKSGTLITTDDGACWYVREDSGQPIALSRNSEWLSAFLSNRFDLNQTTPETRYVVSYLEGYTREHGRQGVVGILSHYEATSGTVLLHGGRKDVYRIDARNVAKIVNGDLDFIFPWRMADDAFTPTLNSPEDVTTLFDGCFDNLIEATPNQALALVRSWFMFLLLRNDAIARPILALLGQPGSGKSTLFRRIYVLLYGTRRAVNTITKPEDFDHAVSTDPFVVFDNVDSHTGWLPDKLATSAAPSALSKRKLYTDNDTFVVRRDALVGISAHNPQFRREDIVDRLVMLNFRRLDSFRPESEIVTWIAENRDRIWAGVIADLQRVLATPKPLETEVPKFRVNDFARIGLWVSRALGFEQDFRAALALNVQEQVSFNLEEEDILVETIQRWLGTSMHVEGKWYSNADLFALWTQTTRDEMIFTRHYKDAVRLGKKLWTLQDTLKTVFTMEVEYDETTGKRLWRIGLK